MRVSSTSRLNSFDALHRIPLKLHDRGVEGWMFGEHFRKKAVYSAVGADVVFQQADWKQYFASTGLADGIAQACHCSMGVFRVWGCFVDCNFWAKSEEGRQEWLGLCLRPGEFEEEDYHWLRRGVRHTSPMGQDGKSGT